MRFFSFFGISDLSKLTWRKYNQDLLDIRNWWDNHDAGKMPFTNVAFGVSSVTQSSAYTAGISDFLILVDSTSAAVTITLPTAVGIFGRIYIVKDWKGKSATHNITIATTSTQTIDGSLTIVQSTNYQVTRVVSDGSNWSVL